MIKKTRESRVNEAAKKYAVRLEEFQRRHVVLEKEGIKFLRQFAERRDKAIRPALRRVGEQLKSFGHDYRISFYTPSSQAEGKGRDGIIMAIHPRDLPHYGEGIMATTSISFLADSLNQRIWLYACPLLSARGSVPRLVGEYSLPDLVNTYDVERHIVDALEVILDPGDLTIQDSNERINFEAAVSRIMHTFVDGLMRKPQEQLEIFLTGNKMRALAQELAIAVRERRMSQPSTKEERRAKLQTLVGRVLRKHRFPPEFEKKALKMITEHARGN
jgi:hypothetical protein